MNPIYLLVPLVATIMLYPTIARDIKSISMYEDQKFFLLTVLRVWSVLVVIAPVLLWSAL